MITKMTAQEAQKFVERNRTSATIQKIAQVAKTATPEMKAQLVAKAQADYEKAVKAYEDAVKFRPSYAPSGTMPRTEQDTNQQRKYAEDFLRYAMSL